MKRLVKRFFYLAYRKTKPTRPPLVMNGVRTTSEKEKLIDPESELEAWERLLPYCQRLDLEPATCYLERPP